MGGGRPAAKAGALALATLAILAAVFFRLTREPSGGGPPPSTSADAGGELLLVEVDQVAQEPREETAALGSAPPAPAFRGFCPDEPPPPDRPSPADGVNARLGELSERARRPEGSEALRRGLTSLYARDAAEQGEAVALLAAAPDRHVGAFDFAAVAAMALGARALDRGLLEVARRWAEEAARLTPGDAAAHAFVGVVAERQGDDVAAARAYGRAFAIDRGEPGVALALARHLARSPDLDRAAEALDAYLAVVPEDAQAAGLRARIDIRIEIQPDFTRERLAGVTLLAAPEVDLSLARRTHRAVVDGLDRAAALLGAPRRVELTAVLYASRADLLASTCVQGWARAAYDGTLHLDGEALAGSEDGDQQIVHEALHAQLDAVAPSAPLWLHEGLAQHLARQWSPEHERSYRLIAERGTWVPFPSLLGTFQVIDDSADARLAYHQSLAMVELLVDRDGEGVIPSLVEALRQGVPPAELLERAAGCNGPITGEELVAFTARRLEEVDRGR